MAKRPIFIPTFKSEYFVNEVQIDFKWNSGFASIQKKKNIVALHEAAKCKGFSPLLEVSTKSEELLGQRLSAFNLKIKSEFGEMSIESAFQGSKVFEHGGPYRDIYKKDSYAAKRDERLKTSGKLIEFDFLGQKWDLVPKTAFYDWLFLTALHPHQDYLKRLFKYNGFTDIEFNPETSINCQARTCALLVSLLKLQLLDEALATQDSFISVVAIDSLMQPHSIDIRQAQLLL